MSGIVIRRAAASDAAALAEAESTQTGSARWGLSGITRELAEPSAAIFAAFDGGKAAGFASARIIGREAQLLNLAVAPGYARRGLASALLREVFNLARSGGCPVVTLEADAENAPALALYGRLGFKTVGRRPKFYDGARDAVLMDLRL